MLAKYVSLVAAGGRVPIILAGMILREAVNEVSRGSSEARIGVVEDDTLIDFRNRAQGWCG